MDFLWFFLISALALFIYWQGRELNKLKERISRIELRAIKSTKQAEKAPVAEKTAPPKTIKKPPKGAIKITPPKVEKNTLKKLEESLSTRWMVWVGGLAIALGGGFLVKYSIDAGILSPAVRVSLGFLMGLALTVSGEILRQRRVNLKWLAGSPDYLPSAISAAGLFSAFAAIYAAYALYDLLPALMAFIGLALLSFAASGLAWYQGRFFAYLGMIGGILVPALVTTGPPSAWGLFPYLLVIIAASLWVSRQKSWHDVAATALCLALLWVFFWVPTNWHSGDIIPVGLYLLLLGGLNGLLLSGASPERLTDSTYSGMMKGNGITLTSDIVMGLITLLLISIVRVDDYSMTGLMLITAGLAAQAYAIHRSPANDLGGVIALCGVMFLFVTWHVPNLLEFQGSLAPFDQLKTAWAPTVPPGLEKFVTTILIFTALTGFVIFGRLQSLMRRNMWASMGNIVPILMLIVTYWRVADFAPSVTFALAALILACLFVIAVNRLMRGKDNITAVAAYAAGATTAISLGIAMVLRDAWLSFALALQIVALAHIWRTLGVRGLRTLALILAAIVFARLTLNGSILDYGSGAPLPAVNWLFYGYGLTAAFFAYAARIFGPEGENDRLMPALRGGAILLTVAFVTLEMRALFSEDHTLSSDPTDLEIALQVINWGIATTILFWYEVKNNDQLFGKLRRFMTLVSLLGMIVGGGMLNNVFFRPVDVGDTAIFNLQFLQFLIPGLLYGFKAYIASRANKPRSLKLYGILAFLVIWFWTTAEVYNGFHPNEFMGTVSDWEWYAYSLAWLLYAVALLLGGLRYDQANIRKAGLLVLAIVVLKVFLVDMNQLAGLSRALSFIGLGGALIGLGYLYQKLGLKNAQN